jgi:hypothetical protein
VGSDISVRAAVAQGVILRTLQIVELPGMLNGRLVVREEPSLDQDQLSSDFSRPWICGSRWAEGCKLSEDDWSSKCGVEEAGRVLTRRAERSESPGMV